MIEEELVELFREAPKESFELLLRNMKIREILEGLYARHISGIELEYNEDFDAIFEEFFRFFFRPLEIAVHGVRQVSFLFMFDFDFFEGQYELMRSYAEFVRSWFSHLKLTTDLMVGRTVPRSVRDVVESFFEFYRQRIDRYRAELSRISSVEYPLTLPKKVFTDFDKAIQHWEMFSDAFTDFERAVRETYRNAAERFIERVNKERFDEYQKFAFAFFDEEARAFDELLKSQDYLDIQSRMLGNLMDHIFYFRSFLEGSLTSNPVNPFATVSMLDEAFKRILDLRRRVRELEIRISNLEKRLEG